MAVDFKKESKNLYMPPKMPVLVQVPLMRFASVDGRGDPNDAGGTYKRALEILYAISFTIRMSQKAGWTIPDYFEYVVPPLEGLWRQDGADGSLDLSRKSDFVWTSMIRLPDFVTPEIFAEAVERATAKKKVDTSGARYLEYDEGLCVQCMHVGSYDGEPDTIQQMEKFAAAEGYSMDIGVARPHHEIYLSDPRRAAPEKLKTIIRLPIR